LATRNDAIFISKLDVQTTFQPLLAPPKRRAVLNSICLDPGHGGKDPGFRVGANQEKKYTLLLAQELREQLKRAGWKVALTRGHDTFVELSERPDVARRKHADLFLSLHFNAVQSSANSVQGAEVYCLTPAGAPSTNAGGEGGGEGWFNGNRYNDQNVVLAYQLQKALTRSLGVEDRGVHRARFAVLRDATMPAALIEAGFMSHPEEGRKIFSAEYRRQIARAIVEGLNAYRQSVSG
jgi:N-acetylmuramoyl-L-alanine amidase